MADDKIIERLSREIASLGNAVGDMDRYLRTMKSPLKQFKNPTLEDLRLYRADPASIRWKYRTIRVNHTAVGGVELLPPVKGVSYLIRSCDMHVNGSTTEILLSQGLSTATHAHPTSIPNNDNVVYMLSNYVGSVRFQPENYFLCEVGNGIYAGPPGAVAAFGDYNIEYIEVQ